MAIRAKNNQMKFYLDDKTKLKFNLALRASSETAQQVLEEAVIEYINKKKSTIQKYAIDCTRLMIVCLFHATGCAKAKTNKYK